MQGGGGAGGSRVGRLGAGVGTYYGYVVMRIRLGLMGLLHSLVTGCW